VVLEVVTVVEGDGDNVVQEEKSWNNSIWRLEETIRCLIKSKDLSHKGYME